MCKYCEEEKHIKEVKNKIDECIAKINDLAFQNKLKLDINTMELGIGGEYNQWTRLEVKIYKEL